VYADSLIKVSSERKEMGEKDESHRKVGGKVSIPSEFPKRTVERVKKKKKRMILF